MVTCLCINVRAINETSPKPEARDVSETVIGRATNSFNMSIKAYGKGKANTAFPLEAGETVTIKASYTPFSAGVDFGLIDADGVFHYINVAVMKLSKLKREESTHLQSGTIREAR